MKICFVSSSFGREREILLELNKHVDLLFIFPYNPTAIWNTTLSAVKKFCEENSINYLIHDLTGRRARSIKGIKYDYKLIQAIRKFSPDVVYVEIFATPYLALLYKLFLGSKTIIAIMDYKLHERQKGKRKFNERFYRFIQLNCFSNFQFFSYSQEALFKLEHPQKTSFAIRLFLYDSDSIERKKSKKEDSITNFLFMGRIFYYKGVDVLLKAANLLALKRKDFVVTIAGISETWEHDYKNLIKDFEVFDFNIRFIEKDEFNDFFSNADYFVAPYREVTQSGPLLRAYNYDIIPIVSSEDGFTEYVDDNKTGFVFENENVESLMEVMEKAIELSLNEKKGIINNIQEFKNEEFNIEFVTQKYIEMFEDVVENKAN